MPRRTSKKAGARRVAESLQEYGRGVAGGLMFSLPLLYTMEVWWAGFSTHPWRLFVYVLVTLTLLLGYNRYAGLRHDASMLEVLIDSIEEMGIGIVLSALMLFLLGRITAEMPVSESAGQIIIEAMTIAIGVSVGTSQLGGKAVEEDQGEDAQQTEQGEIHFGGQMVLALCGAVLFASNLAPTEEIVIIAIEASWIKLLGLALVSLVIGTFILHYSEFTGAKKFVRTDGFNAVLLGTVITYAVALLASALILFFFGRFDGVPFYTMMAQTVVLGVAATLGASAGRLLLQ